MPATEISAAASAAFADHVDFLANTSYAPDFNDAAAYAAHTVFVANFSDTAAKADYAAANVNHVAASAADTDSEIDPMALLQIPIWHEPKEPDSLISALIPHTNLLDSGSEWSFWREWYQGFLDGKPLDWELQKEIALIPNADWEKGPEWIAGKIEVIRKRRDLEAEIAKLKEKLELAQQAAKLPLRLHNQPPEAVEDAEQMFKREITVVWSEIEALEKEISKPDPSPTVLKKIASRLSEIAVSIAKYCGSIADVSLKAGAKAVGNVIGKAAGTVILAEVALPGSMQAVVKSILEFVKALGG